MEIWALIERIFSELGGGIQGMLTIGAVYLWWRERGLRDADRLKYDTYLQSSFEARLVREREHSQEMLEGIKALDTALRTSGGGQ